ncbi:tetratricopeptide repeat protein [Pseudanabaena mucicola]|uniref:tetratricopeptide repeat protein n=1 Tax=Pseudanabaena mucicola TaxID=71190 RepID=UPI0025761EC8|nr:tetratricopeptide repeat protein [Pseudanabaena mucicola]
MKATISASITAAALSILTSNTGDLFAQSINIQSLSTNSGQKIADVSQVGTIQDSVELMRQAKDLYNQGRIPEAFPLAKRSLAITENLLGSDHVGVAYVLNFLGVLYHTSGDLDQAEALYQRAIKIYQSANHANLQETRDNLAVLQRHPSRQSSFSYIFKSASSSNQISDGKYSDGQGYGEVFIEVKGDQYRWVDVTQPQLDRTWKPVSELQYVRNGVIYYKNEYLCSDKAQKLDEDLRPKRPGNGFFCVSEGITYKRPANKIADGDYYNGFVDGEATSAIFIKGEQYSDDAAAGYLGRPMIWKPFSESGIRYVAPGIIYYPKIIKPNPSQYYCTKEVAGWNNRPNSRRQPIGTCSKDGWTWK